MARYGVLGDIHGNREALEAALEALEARGIERFLCVGDIVGYNADADDCVSMIYARRCATVAGNHDLIATRQLGFSRCSNDAMHALRRTRRTLKPASAAWLRALPPHRVVDGSIVLVHGGVRDVQQYMKTSERVRANAALLRADFPQARLCFFGHTHDQKIYELDDDRVVDVTASIVSLSRERLCFVNPGSIDASRKRSGRFAECAIVDTTAWQIELLAVRYDAASAEIKAGMGGYRIGPWTERAYAWTRRLARFARSLRMPRFAQ